MGGIVPVVLAGGAGSGLWPLSDPDRPKPFIRLGDGHSLLQKAWQRALLVAGVRDIVTVTADRLFVATRAEFEKLAVAGVAMTCILEPCRRNTAPAIGIAAAWIAARHGADTVLLVLPADHLVNRHAALRHAFWQAIRLSRQNKLVTFGIPPTGPHTGFGYIRRHGHRVVGFIEKPDLDTARELIESPDVVWNSGMFCFKAATILAEMQRYCPDLARTIKDCAKNLTVSATGGTMQVTMPGGIFEKVQNISVDHAVMEKSGRIAVVACDIAWSDIGSWAAFGDTLPADPHGNRIVGDVLTRDVRHCTIHATTQIAGCFGLRNLVIVSTPKGLLIAAREAVAGLRHYQEQLAREHPDTGRDTRA